MTPLALSALSWVYAALTYLAISVAGLVVVAVTAGFVVGPALLLLSGAAEFRKWWYMRRIDPSEGGSIERGTVTISGTARPVREPGTGPFSGEDAVAWRTRVESYTSGSREGSHWHRVNHETGGVPFEVQVDGKTVAVDPENAQFLGEADYEFTTDGTDELPAGVRDYVEDPDEPLNTKIGPYELGSSTTIAGRYRFREDRVEPGGKVYVLGEVERKPTAVPTVASGEYVMSHERDGPLRRLLGAPFVISDATPRDATGRQLKKGLKQAGFGLFMYSFFGAIVYALFLT